MNTLNSYEIPGHVSIIEGQGGLCAIRIETEWSSAEVYLLGAHVTRFGKKGEAPLLFMSGLSDFQAGKPIRGGVPVIYPWFGPREGLPSHGFARLAEWDLTESTLLPDGAVRLVFKLPPNGPGEVVFAVTVGRTLVIELVVTNDGAEDLAFETCLHTYFNIGDIHRIEVSGLHGVRYIDKVSGEQLCDSHDVIRFSGEVDRVYQDTDATVEIRDPALKRAILVRKNGSHSTIVWNPWIEKSKRMPDFGDEEYLKMVCVESGNVGDNAPTLTPGDQSTLRVELDSVALG